MDALPLQLSGQTLPNLITSLIVTGSNAITVPTTALVLAYKDDITIMWLELEATFAWVPPLASDTEHPDDYLAGPETIDLDEIAPAFDDLEKETSALNASGTDRARKCWKEHQQNPECLLRAYKHSFAL